MTENWDRKTWRLAGPVILSNISVPLLSAVDIAVVGHLPGPQYVGAVAVGALIFNVIFHIMNFLRMGTTGLTAQSYGAGDHVEVRAWLLRASLLGVVIGAIVVALQWPVMWAALLVIEPSAAVGELAADYFLIRIWGGPATLLVYAMTGWFFGVQNTRAALIIQIFMNGLNIALDILFVVGFGMGVEGVAIATIIAEFSAVLVGAHLVRRELQRIGGEWNLGAVRNTRRLKRMVQVNTDIFIRSMGVQTSLIVFTAVGARMGDVELAANVVLFHLNSFTTYGLDGFANAAEALTGEAVGARDKKRFREAVRATFRWAVICAALFALFFAVAGPWCMTLMTSVPAVLETAHIYFPWVVAMPFVSVWCFHLDGIFIGSTWTRQMRDGMAISLVVYLLSIWLAVPAFGNHGLWFSYALYLAFRGVTLGAWYPGLARRIGA